MKNPATGLLSIAAAVAVSMAGTVKAAEDTEPKKEIEEVTVTGSRIQQLTGMTTPTPVAALAAPEIANMAPGNISDALSQLPQFYASSTAATFNGANNGFFG